MMLKDGMKRLRCRIECRMSAVYEFEGSHINLPLSDAS